MHRAVLVARFVDHDKGRHGTTCADTWSYDGAPGKVTPQPAEDGSCS